MVYAVPSCGSLTLGSQPPFMRSEFPQKWLDCDLTVDLEPEPPS